MNSYAVRITVVVSIVALAAAISLTAVPHDGQGKADAARIDPSVPAASDALRNPPAKPAEGNVHDMTY
jgi:hypothetical protein